MGGKKYVTKLAPPYARFAELLSQFVGQSGALRLEVRVCIRTLKPRKQRKQYVWLNVWSICTCVFKSYPVVPKAHSTKSWHQIHDNDGNLDLCNINPAWGQWKILKRKIQTSCKKAMRKCKLLWMEHIKRRLITQLTSQNGEFQKHRSATGHRRTWTSQRNRRRTSSLDTFLSHRIYMFPRQQTL